jgi:hypothetical protein
MLEKRGAVLETARRVSALLRANDVEGAIIGGVAVVLHGHVRTTKDVDVFVMDSLTTFRPILEEAGALYDPKNREFRLDAIPIHLVDEKMAQPTPRKTVVIDEITTVSLPDLINLKLRSGLRNIRRTQDIADVIGLIEHHKLSGAFASKLDKSLQKEFRELVRALKKR